MVIRQQEMIGQSTLEQASTLKTMLALKSN